MRRADLADLAAFVAVADNLSFRAGASRLGVTPSALSHTMRQLEERLGVRLLNRTTRSVSLTDAGLRLLDRLRPAVERISRALDDLKGEHPFGRLRLYVSHFAGVAVIAPVWARFLSTFPDVQLEVHAAEALVDIVAKGFDAGIGSKDLAAADMIAVRVMGPLRVAMVGAPAYFGRRRPPRTPDDLAAHSCVQYRLAGDGAVFEWVFERGGKSRRISVDGRVIVNDPDLAMRAAVDGLGNRVHGRSARRPVPALGAAASRAGGLVTLLRGALPLLSRPPASAGRAARLHRHAPHRVRVGTSQRLAREPLRGRVNPAEDRRSRTKFRSLVLVGVPVEVALTRIGAPSHVQAFVAHTMALANSGSTEEVFSNWRVLAPMSPMARR
jgi:DNA-binding transcriptional LysR family regulator